MPPENVRGKSPYRPSEELYNRLFARQDVGNRATPQPGADVEETVVVTLREAYQGTTRLVELASGRLFAVQIPPGVATGTRVRITGYGKRGTNGGVRGDLYLRIEVKPCPTFARRGDDLYHQCSLNLAELALGTEIHIKILNGRILAITVPAGTRPGQRFRLTGEGMPQLHQPGYRGDLYVTVNDQLPPRAAPASASNDAAWQDSLVGHIFHATIFLLGIGVGFIFYWFILD